MAKLPPMKRDPYQTLGVPKSASAAEVKRAYRKRAKRAHPDAGGKPEEFMALQRAYSILSDDERRRRYDETGDDERPSPEAVEAQLAEIVADLAVQNGPSQNLLNLVRIGLKNAALDWRKQRDAARERARKIKNAANRITAKNRANVISLVLKAKADQVEAQAQSLDARAREAEEGIALLDCYSYRADPEDLFGFPKYMRDMVSAYGDPVATKVVW